MSEKKKTRRGIDQLKPDLWRVRVYWQHKQVHVGTYETLEAAEIALDIARGEMAARTFVPPAEQRRKERAAKKQKEVDRTSVKQWADRWLGLLSVAGRSDGTILTYRSALNVHIIPAVGHKRVADVTPVDIRKILDAAEGPGARQNAFRVARALFQAAAAPEIELIKSSPVDRVPAPATDRKKTPAQLSRSKLLSDTELAELTQAMPPELRIAVTLAAWCALRLGEVLGLQRGDFVNLESDTERAYLTVERQWMSKATPPRYGPPKAGSMRDISIPSRAIAPILEHLNTYVSADPESPVLPSASDPARPVAQTTFDRHWRAARDTVRRGYRFHDLRHYGLTKYAQTGATLREIMARAGHSDEKVALLYQHSSLERDHENTERM